MLTGSTTFIGNYGNVINKGIELKLNSMIVDHADFLWSTNLNLAYNNGKITKLGQNFTNSDIMSSAIIFAEGYAPGSIFAYYYGGLDAEGRPTEKIPDGAVKDGKPLSSLHYMGSIISPWIGGWNNIATYKNLTLSSTIVFNLGGVMRRNVNLLYTDRMIEGVSEEFANRWKKPGDEAFTNIPGFTNDKNLIADTKLYTYSDVNVVSSSYIKMRDITLSYQLPQRWMQIIKARSISFRVQVSNIMLWKANKYGLDPEFQDAFYGNVYSNVVKNPYMVNTSYSYPVGQNAITFGIHAGF